MRIQRCGEHCTVYFCYTAPSHIEDKMKANKKPKSEPPCTSCNEPHEVVSPQPTYKTVYHVTEYHYGLSTPKVVDTFDSKKAAKGFIDLQAVINVHATYKINSEKIRVE